MIKLTIAGVEVNALTEHDAIIITPDDARKLLNQDNRNFRKVSRNEIQKHVKSMKDGRWKFNGDSIAINADGLVKDGQHRLIACMESNVPLKVLPIKIDSDINIDDKKKLSFDKILTGLGYHNCNTLAAIVKTLYRRKIGIVNFYINKSEIDNNTLLDYFNANPSIVDSLNITTTYSRKCGVPHSLLGVFYHIASESNQDLAREFIRILSLPMSEYERIGITNLNSMYHLKRMITKTKSKEHIDHIVLIALVIKAWNCWIEQTPCKGLSWNCTGANPENFPAFA